MDTYQQTLSQFSPTWLFAIGHYTSCLASNNHYTEALNMTFALYNRDKRNPRLLSLLGSLLIQSGSQLMTQFAQLLQPHQRIVWIQNSGSNPLEIDGLNLTPQQLQVWTRGNEWETKGHEFLLQTTTQLDPTSWLSVSLLVQFYRDRYHYDNLINLNKVQECFVEQNGGSNNGGVVLGTQLETRIIKNTIRLKTALDLLHSFINTVGEISGNDTNGNINNTITTIIPTPHHITNSQAHLLLGQLYALLAQDYKNYNTLVNIDRVFDDDDGFCYPGVWGVANNNNNNLTATATGGTTTATTTTGTTHPDHNLNTNNIILGIGHGMGINSSNSTANILNLVTNGLGLEAKKKTFQQHGQQHQFLLQLAAAHLYTALKLEQGNGNGSGGGGSTMVGAGIDGMGVGGGGGGGSHGAGVVTQAKNDLERITQLFAPTSFPLDDDDDDGNDNDVLGDDDGHDPGYDDGDNQQDGAGGGIDDIDDDEMGDFVD